MGFGAKRRITVLYGGCYNILHAGAIRAFGELKCLGYILGQIQLKRNIKFRLDLHHGNNDQLLEPNTL